MKKQKLTRYVHIRLSEEDYKLLIQIRNESKVSTSEMVRSSVQFYAAYYTEPQNKQP